MLKHIQDKEVIWDSQHGFIKGKWCWPVWCLPWWSDCNIGQEKTNLKFCRAFDMVPFLTLISRLEKHTLVRWTIWRIRTWLHRHSQWVVINGSISWGGWWQMVFPWALSLGWCSLISLSTTQTRSSAHSAGLQVTQSWMVHFTQLTEIMPFRGTWTNLILRFELMATPCSRSPSACAAPGSGHSQIGAQTGERTHW